MLQRIEQALEYAATCVALHGDAYLPLFERLEAELLAAQAKESALERARRLARHAQSGR
ncbi:hypothetical protein [uncultured Paracoccus sp.]|uniref:hypothetical protein n=1 Tax=uncultured Paracoccus sp. TaxID=189685 RepID=UPI0026353A6A|nr:hypothetical protein [uncultured Paracoccus sp.]